VVLAVGIVLFALLASRVRRGWHRRRDARLRRRLAGQTRGHGITADGVAEEVIPVDRGLPGHGGPLLFPD
jgi:hypothetical protein